MFHAICIRTDRIISWYTITIFCPEKKSSADDHLESHPHCPKL